MWRHLTLRGSYVANVGHFSPAVRPVPYTPNAADWGPDHNHPCPCGSTKLAGNCHVNRARGNWKLPWYKPPLTGSRTGIACPGCYVSFTNDCSPDLSSEHWLSRGIILEVGTNGKVIVNGLLSLGQETVVQASEFANHILCKRHNNALNRLDATAVAVFRTLHHYQKDQASQPDPHGSEFDLFSGERLERWLLKLLWGGIAAGVFSASQLRSGVDQNMLADYLFRNQKLPDDWGLGIAFQSGVGIRADGPVAVATGVGPDGTIWKVAVSMGVVSFGFGLGQQKANQGFDFQLRPQAIILKSRQDTAEKALALGWDHKASGRPIDYTYQGI
jgi:hypothetical protein